MFNRKKLEIQKLKAQKTKLLENQKEDIEDFILILKQIQELNNQKLQWKHRQSTVNNAIDLAVEKYTTKKVELDIDPQ